MSKKVIGIDLGTTNSCVSTIEFGKPVVIQNSEGKRTTPSIVGFDKNNERKVGEPAKRQLVTNPNTIYSIKRIIGKKYNDVKHLKFPFNVIEGTNGLAVVEIDGKEYTPQEISAIILQKMKKTAEDYLGVEVTDAVITVPAYFSDQERTATKEAAIIAGLNPLRIINEPTAAALSYGLDKDDKDRKIAVFDLGGGTFDISILELGSGVFEVLSTNGNVSLGGDNFDEVIIDWIVEEFKKQHNIDLRKDKIAYQRIRENAERAKMELSSAITSDINLPYIIPIDGIPQHINLTLTRAKFESMVDGLLNEIKTPCLKALKDSKLQLSDIDEVILVGGSTRIPIVQKLVKDIFGKEPSKSVNPDESVSLGAAIQAGVLNNEITDVLLLDVIPISLGIEVAGGIFNKLIDSNSTIPVSKEQVYSTYSDNQNSVQINVLQGEREMAKYNKSIGMFNLNDIPSAPRGVPQISVKFDVDVNGILKVTATDKGTGKVQSIKIDNSSSLSEDEINRMKEDAKINADSDKKEKEKVDKLNQADSLIFQTEKQITEFGDKLTESDKTNLTEKVEKLKEFHKEQNLDSIDKSMNELNETWHKISEKLYADVNTQNQQTTETSNDKKEEPVDVDFEDIK